MCEHQITKNKNIQARVSYIKVLLNLLNRRLVKFSSVSTEAIDISKSARHTTEATLVDASFVDAVDPMDVLADTVAARLEGDDVSVLDRSSSNGSLGEWDSEARGDKGRGRDGDALEIDHDRLEDDEEEERGKN